MTDALHATMLLVLGTLDRLPGWNLVQSSRMEISFSHVLSLNVGVAFVGKMLWTSMGEHMTFFMHMFLQALWHKSPHTHTHTQ